MSFVREALYLVTEETCFPARIPVLVSNKKENISQPFLKIQFSHFNMTEDEDPPPASTFFIGVIINREKLIVELKSLKLNFASVELSHRKF